VRRSISPIMTVEEKRMGPDQSCRPSGTANGAKSKVDVTGFCRKHWFAIALLTITLVGAALRIVHLDSTIACDEASAMGSVMRYGLYGVFHMQPGQHLAETFHRLNAILAVISARTLGNHMWAWRLPSYLFGVGLIPLMALFVKHAFQNRRIALLAATLVTFSPPLISYSPANRGFASLAFFTVAACFSLLKVLDSPTIFNLAVLVFTTFCLGISHMFALVLLGALGCYLALHIVISLSSKTLKAHGTVLAFAGLLVGVVLTVWLYSRTFDLVPVVWERITTGSFPEGGPIGTNLRKQSSPIAEWFVTMQSYNFRCQRRLVPIYWFLIIAGAPAVLRRYRRAGWLIICGVFLSLAVCCALHVTPIQKRYVLFMLPLMLVLIASSIDFIAGAMGSVVARIAGKNLDWCSTAVSVILVVATCGPGTPAIFGELRGPGSRYMGVMWDCKNAAKLIGRRVRQHDVVLSFPLDPSKRSIYARTVRTRLFTNSMRPHLFLEVYPRLAEMSTAFQSSRVWYVTPRKDDPETEFLPSTVAPRLEAEFDNCFVYSYDVQCPNMRQIRVPGFDLGMRENGVWQAGRLSKVPRPTFTVRPPQESPWHNPFVEVKINDQGTFAHVTSRFLPVVPGRIVHVFTRTAAEQPHQPRPQMNLRLRYYNASGERFAGSFISPPLNPKIYDLSQFASTDWYACRASSVVPQQAHYAEIHIRIGGHTSAPGDLIRVLEPSLLADWSESEVLAQVFGELDGKPLPDDMSDFESLTIDNSDFQTEDGKVSGWSSQRYSGKVKYEAREVQGLEHSRFVRVTVQEDNTNWALYSEPVTVVSGSTLRLMADVTNVSSTTAVVMRFLDAEGKRITDVYSFASRRGVPLVPGSEWSSIRIDRKVPKKATQLCVGLRITEASLAGDTFMFRPVSVWVKDGV